MPKPILVAFDPKTVDRAPVHFGVAAAAFTGAPLIVGSVYASSVVIGTMGGGQMEEELAEDASEPLELLRTELDGQGVRADFRALPGGSPASALHRAAESFDAGLMVIGSSGRGRVGRLLPGSTADRLMHGAPCPIAVVPCGWEPGEGLKTVGVAYADTPEGNQALTDAIALARAAGAKLRILAAVKPHPFGKVGGSGPQKEVTTFDKSGTELEALSRRLVERANQAAPDVDVECDLSVQDAADFLIAASENVDLLVCGSRGYGPQRAVLLGGVSRKVTAGAHCPVIVLARGVEAGLEALMGEHSGATA